jgi:protein ImuA
LCEKNISGTYGVIESVKSLAALRRHIASLDGDPAVKAGGRVATGSGAFDRALDGGLARGRVHELFGAPEEGAAAGFALILGRLAAGEAPLLWLRTAAAQRAGGVVFGPGLAALGVAPENLLLGTMADDAMLLRAAVDGLRCAGLGALVVELHGRAPLLDLTASRRLALAAETSGVTAFLLRVGGDPVPSAAETRWRVMSAPSVPLPGNAPGMSAFMLHLLRRRSGPDGLCWRLVWDSGRAMFEEISGEGRDERHDHGQDSGGKDRPAPLSGPVVSVPADRPAADRAA